MSRQTVPKRKRLKARIANRKRIERINARVRRIQREGLVDRSASAPRHPDDETTTTPSVFTMHIDKRFMRKL
jgi:hypothetical protein